MTSVSDWLFTHWNLAPVEIRAVGPVFKAAAPSGLYCVKPGKHGRRRMLFHAHAINALHERGFTGTPRFLPTADGKLFADTPNGPVALTEWVGRTLDFTCEAELEGAAAALADFHRTSQGLLLPARTPKVYFKGKWLRRFHERTAKLQAHLAAFDPARHPFEEAVAPFAPELLQSARDALARLEASAYLAMSARLREVPALVHGNVKAENFTIDEGGRIFLIDFDGFRIDLWVQDLSDLLGPLSVEEARRTLAAYQEVRPLAEEELPVLRALLAFPYDLWNAVNKYVTHDRSLEKNLRKWNRALAGWERRRALLANWDDWVLNEKSPRS